MAPPPPLSIIAGIAKRDTRNMLSTLTCMIGRLRDDIDDEHLGAGAGQEDRRSAAIADPVIGSAAAGHDRDLAVEAEFVFCRLRVAHACTSLVMPHDSERLIPPPRSARQAE